MRFFSSNWLLLSAYISAILLVLVSSKSTDDKSSKHFSLFSVVTFQNAECTSESTLTGGATQGTCYTSTECTDKGGMKSGNCASGFGVCCVMLNTGGITASITENRTRLRNSEFPSYATATAANTIVYTVNKMSSDICQLRLDFTTFIIAGPSNTRESFTTGDGTTCVDSLRITTTEATTWTNSQTGTLCGALTGEHLYVDLTRTSTDVAILTLVTAATATITPVLAARVWDVKTSQIECFASYRAPDGCQRYFTEDTGKIISYNFYRITGTTPNATPFTTGGNSGLELALQRVNTCIRRSKGMCCVEYQVCAAYNSIALTDVLTAISEVALEQGGDLGNWNEGWSIDMMLAPYLETTIQANIGMADSQCSGDYVEIPSSWSASCGAGTSSGRNAVFTRYCGARLGHNGQKGNEAAPMSVSTPICDCSEPFVVRHSSDDSNDTGGISGVTAGNSIDDTTAFPRGFCLDFKQLPCWQ